MERMPAERCESGGGWKQAMGEWNMRAETRRRRLYQRLRYYYLLNYYIAETKGPEQMEKRMAKRPGKAAAAANAIGNGADCWR